MNNFFKVVASVSLMVLQASSLHAEVSAGEAGKLGTSLTPVGAEKAGNADGTIPAYTGGLTTVPAGFNKASGVRPDPYANEKPLFSIDAGNVDKYADKLTDGAKALIKARPGFRADVYATHRSVAYPQVVLDNTIKNATRAKLTEDGLGVTGVWGGIPFPIPKDGNEVMQNHLLRYRGVAVHVPMANVYYVDANGKRYVSTIGQTSDEWPYYGKSEGQTDVLFRTVATYVAPARRVGEAAMLIDPINNSEKARRAWSYLPGQRRVRVAPDISYDTPNPSTGGMSTYDDNYMFNGKLDRFDWKLVGKREIYVPYNTYRLTYAGNPDEVLQPKMINPASVRWELHRVWVVEGKLKSDKRHVYSKRMFYIDEDSWHIVSADQYDGRGQLWRIGFNFLAPAYDALAPAAFMGAYDLVAGGYYIYQWPSAGGVKFSDKLTPDSEWSADALAQKGIR